jgi:phosphorylcholine metabolism protein LicD
MSTHDIAALRAVQLELLEAFMGVCEREGLRWYAFFGTMLGAARNGGFLVWDDDVDVVVPAEDYARLWAHKEWFDGGKYTLQTPQDPGRPRFLKLRRNGTTGFTQSFTWELKRGGHLGIGIDILPLDPVPGSGNCIIPVLRGEKAYPIYPMSLFDPPQRMPFERLTVNVPARYHTLTELAYPGGWSWPSGAENSQPHYWFFDTARDYSEYVRRYTGMLDGIEGERVALFGAAGSLKLWLEYYGLGDQVVCVYDNSPAKWGTKAHGVEVRDPAGLPALVAEGGVRVIVTSVWHREIGQQLEGLGVKDYYVFIDRYPYRDRDAYARVNKAR